jgi:hypothetical protein
MSSETIPAAREAVRKRYEQAVEAFVARVREDSHILAAILYGSLSYDDVWEHSDVDMWLIARDENKKVRDYCLLEKGVNIHAFIFPRAEFRKRLEGALQGSFIHSSFARSRLLYSHDEGIRDWFEAAQHVGERDRDIQVMRYACMLFASLTKAEKWLTVKRDPAYSYVWVLYLLNWLASIEVLRAGQVPGREVIHQALAVNPEFFTAIYAGPIHQPKSEALVAGILTRIHAYLDANVQAFFRPLFAYLAEAGEPRSVTELNDHFQKRAQTESIALACEWLADKGLLGRISAPLRLTEKSRVTVEEAAYYYDAPVGVEF